VEIKPATKIHKTKKVRIINKSHDLSDEQLAEKLSGEVSDMPCCSDSDWHEIIMRIPSFVNLEVLYNGLKSKGFEKVLSTTDLKQQLFS
jgi:hypothetical protein